MRKRIDRSKYLTKSQLKSERGWTDAMIRDVLREPDERTTNMNYQSGPKVQWYSLDRVVKCESHPDFQAKSAAGRKRRAKALEVAERKRKESEEWISSLQIEVPEYEWDDLVRRACDHYNNSGRGVDLMAAPSSDPDFLDRICVNYLRHQTTAYDQLVDSMKGAVGAADHRLEIKQRVLDAISDAYPGLASECDDQADRAEGSYWNDFANRTLRK